MMEGSPWRSSVVQKFPTFHETLSVYYQNLSWRKLMHFMYPQCTSSVWFILILYYYITLYYINAQTRCFHVISNLIQFRRNLFCISDLFLLKTTLSFIINSFRSIPITSKRNADIAPKKYNKKLNIMWSKSTT